VLVDLNATQQVDKSNIYYKCGWSPFEGVTFHSKIAYTFVNGNLVYENGTFNESVKGMALEFDRQLD
jgi:dihydroorotase